MPWVSKVSLPGSARVLYETVGKGVPEAVESMAILIEDSSAPDIEEYVPTLEEVNDTRFWLSLNPHFTISRNGSQDKIAPLPIDVTEEMIRYLRSDGYIQVDNIISGKMVASLRKGIVTLRDQGINPSFVFVYDEFWTISRQLSRLLTPVLGETYQQLPDFWAWYLDPQREEAGWRPHRDRIHGETVYPDGMPKSVTVWVALTDATPLNGCIYMLPAHLDNDYFNFNIRDTNVNAHGIRALPATAGTLLMWNQRVVHWGGTSCPRTREPRISMAIEYQRADVPPFNTPLIKAPEKLLPFDIRLMLIAKQFTQYHHMYKLSPALAELANSILD